MESYRRRIDVHRGDNIEHRKQNLIFLNKVGRNLSHFRGLQTSGSVHVYELTQLAVSVVIDNIVVHLPSGASGQPLGLQFGPFLWQRVSRIIE